MVQQNLVSVDRDNPATITLDFGYGKPIRRFLLNRKWNKPDRLKETIQRTVDVHGNTWDDTTAREITQTEMLAIAVLAGDELAAATLADEVLLTFADRRPVPSQDEAVAPSDNQDDGEFK